VGYVVYLSLDAGTYAQAYQIPSTALNCTLTTIETVLQLAPWRIPPTDKQSRVLELLAFSVGRIADHHYFLNTGLHFTKLASTVQTTVSLTPMTNSS